MLVISFCTLEPKFAFVTFPMGSGHFRPPKYDVLSLVFDSHMSKYPFHRLDNLAATFHRANIASLFWFMKWVNRLVFIVIDICFSRHFRFETMTGSHSIFESIKNIERIHFWSLAICSHIHFEWNLTSESTFQNIQIQFFTRIIKTDIGSVYRVPHDIYYLSHCILVQTYTSYIIRPFIFSKFKNIVNLQMINSHLLILLAVGSFERVISLISGLNFILSFFDGQLLTYIWPSEQAKPF